MVVYFKILHRIVTYTIQMKYRALHLISSFFVLLILLNEAVINKIFKRSSYQDS